MMNPFAYMMSPLQRKLIKPFSCNLKNANLLWNVVYAFFVFDRCLKTINSKKYGVDLVCFTSHPTTVIYSSKNGWDGMVAFNLKYHI